jgi:hypothetical protein
MFVSTTATYKTSNALLPLQSTRVHITAQPCHTSSHHRSAVSHGFTSPFSRVRVNQSLIVCVLFGRPLSFCPFCFGHDSCLENFSKNIIRHPIRSKVCSTCNLLCIYIYSVALQSWSTRYSRV